MEQSQTQHGMRQSQYQGPERRHSQMPYQGTERRRLDWPFKAPRMSAQERKDEQAERAREQQKEQGDRM